MRSLGALTSVVLASLLAPVGADASVPGRWSGTVTFSSAGAWDYTIGYRGEPERRSQAKSSHSLGWTMKLDGVEGTSDFTHLESDSGSVALESFVWSGSASGPAGSPDCSFTSSGSMVAPSLGGLAYAGLDENGEPVWSIPDSAVIPLSLSGSECQPAVIFGFSGPNAGTLWHGGGYDVFLLNRHVDYGATQPPRFTLCSEAPTVSGTPTARTDDLGRTSVRETVSGTCSGRRVEWFGDSDVHHDSQVDFTYAYDLTFRSDVTECADGLDNDLDGTVDAASAAGGGGDPGCTSAGDFSEFGDAQCDNGVDDDDNGLTDHRPGSAGDPGCDSLEDRREGSGPCTPTKSKTMSLRTVTRLPSAPDVHWFTSKVRVELCKRGDRRYITGLDVDRHVEKGPVPRLIGLAGWRSGTETPTSYDPRDPDEVLVGSARFTYTACFDLLKLLDKGGLKDRLKDRVKRPLRKGIAKVLRKSGLTKIDKTVRGEVLEKFKKRVDHAFRKGIIKSYLHRKFKIPKRIGRAAERLAMTQKSRTKHILKSHVSNALASGRYDYLTAEAASSAITAYAFKELAEQTSFCGGTAASDSWFRLWDASVVVSAGDKVEFLRDDLYKHPLLSVRRD